MSVGGDFKPPTTWPEYVFLTRDSDDDGVLSDTVEVWSECPILTKTGKSVLWMAPNIDDILLGRYELNTLSRLRTLPQTDRECIRLPAK